MKKKIIIIHGRAKKLPEEKKKELVMKSLMHGLGRVSDEIIKELKNSENMEIKFVYYGDVTSAIDWISKNEGIKYTQDFLEKEEFPYDEDRYEKYLDKMFEVEYQTKEIYEELKKDSGIEGYLDNILDIVSSVSEFIGLGEEILDTVLPDVGAYFQSKTIGSIIRTRLRSEIMKSFDNKEELCIIAHSLGTVITYDVLWQLSRLHKYREYWHDKISLLITLGAPLGEPGMYNQLYDANEPVTMRFPQNIENWENFSAQDDPVCHDDKIRDNFIEMINRGYIEDISDHKIYNFWVSDKGLNPHKFYAYLDNKNVAEVISKWLASHSI